MKEKGGKMQRIVFALFVFFGMSVAFAVGYRIWSGGNFFFQLLLAPAVTLGIFLLAIWVWTRVDNTLYPNSEL